MMPGSPEPTFGTVLLDLWFAVGTAAAVVTILFLAWEPFDSPKRYAIRCGVGYATVCLGVYAVPRILLDAFVTGVLTAPYLAWVLLAVIPMLVAQGGIPAYLFAERGSRGAVAGLFLATVLTVTIHLGLGGESDVLILYPYVLPGLAAVLVFGSVAVELGTRATLARMAQ